MKDNLPDTATDESVEARIIAWALGEASAFEAAELKRLCEEKPEWLIFRRRMDALHSLLTEAEPDETWKLPAEKRQVLYEIFHREKTVRSETPGVVLIRRNVRRVLIAIAACVMLALVVTGLSGFGKSKMGKISASSPKEKDVDFMTPSQGQTYTMESTAAVKKNQMIPLADQVRQQKLARQSSTTPAKTSSVAQSYELAASPEMKALKSPALASDRDVMHRDLPTLEAGSSDLVSPVRDAAEEMSALGEDRSMDQALSAEVMSSYSALTRGHPQNADKLKKSLYRAEKKIHLGKYDVSKKAYEEILKSAPDNTDARKGLDRVSAATGDMVANLRKHSVFSDNDIPAEETIASENPYSTFPLNVTDASFQLAMIALKKGERPDPAVIKPEQFYNAVDYGDPAPASDEPVVTTIEQSLHPVIPGQSLIRLAVRTGASGRSVSQPLRLTLLIDQSRSMAREDRREMVERGISQLGLLLTKADLVNVINVSRTPRLLAEGMTGDQAAKLSGLVDQSGKEDGTNLEEALKLGGELAVRHQLPGAKNRILIITDGAANLNNADAGRLAAQLKSLRQRGIVSDVASIAADEKNVSLLVDLARKGAGRYYVVGDKKGVSLAQQLAGTFRPAAENVKIQVIFNPRRVAKYKLIGFEKDRLKTKNFHNGSIDAAESAGGRSGNAIYQIEEIQNGAGEIGEVSVRFRDTTTGEMVERSWTLPHHAAPTAFDRAAPSIQLAGLSLLASEKLRGGPLAVAIDFKQFTSSIHSVRKFYHSSPRVAEMLYLIDSIK